MYLSHFGLREPPFSITPDPRFLYMSARHREALAHLVYGVGEHGGFVQLTGEVGTGKTSICRCLLGQLPDRVDVALVLNPRVSPVELLALVCDELRIPYPAGTKSQKDLVDRLHHHLLEAHIRGRRTVLIIDEAQTLAPEVLEEVRLLTNLETTTDKLLQVIMIGQPELAALLEQATLRQLAQRVTARYHLEPLSSLETRAYVRHRLGVAGRVAPVFTPGALRQLYRETYGIPRLINAIADRALLGAYAREQTQVDAATVRRAGAEVLGRPFRAWQRWLRGAAVVALVAAVAGAGFVFFAPGVAGRDEARRAVAKPGPAVPTLTGAASTPTSPPAGALEPAAAPRLADVLRDPAVPATKEDALAVLLDLWGVHPPTGGPPDCKAPPMETLECLEATGTWQKLRRLDLPAALELASPEGERRYAVLTGLTPSEATLRFGDRVVTALLADIEPFWDGAFVMFWRPPPGALPIQRGARGPATDWLRERMARSEGAVPAIERGRPYDEGLQQQVAGFQDARSLEPHGVVGRETAILLRRAEWGAQVPRLAGGGP
jgi:general secretion pathway protein A